MFYQICSDAFSIDSEILNKLLHLKYLGMKKHIELLRGGAPIL